MVAKIALATENKIAPRAKPLPDFIAYNQNAFATT